MAMLSVPLAGAWRGHGRGGRFRPGSGRVADAAWALRCCARGAGGGFGVDDHRCAARGHGSWRACRWPGSVRRQGRLHGHRRAWRWVQRQWPRVPRPAFNACGAGSGRSGRCGLRRRRQPPGGMGNSSADSAAAAQSQRRPGVAAGVAGRARGGASSTTGVSVLAAGVASHRRSACAISPALAKRASGSRDSARIVMADSTSGTCASSSCGGGGSIASDRLA